MVNLMEFGRPGATGKYCWNCLNDRIWWGVLTTIKLVFGFAQCSTKYNLDGD